MSCTLHTEKTRIADYARAPAYCALAETHAGKSTTNYGARIGQTTGQSEYKSGDPGRTGGRNVAK
ncbi:hypothetical protein YTPLAS18_11660 [Nitrospira sp.]|nr:hypothetical protein YTPLAS18_11660 [Nitrospira sp.]